MVPMRSLINYVLDHRRDYGHVTILYVCKEPCQIMFHDEIAKWEEHDDVVHMLSVDSCKESDCW